MKFGLLLTLLMMCQLSLAETIKAKKNRELMMERIETLEQKIVIARDQLKKLDAVAACESINEIHRLYREHVTDIGGNMDLSSKKVVDASRTSLAHLMMIHKHKLTCEQGEDCEYLDPERANSNLKAVSKELKKHKKLIKKKETGFENDFRWEYEIQI